MNEERVPNQFITGDAAVSGNPQYQQWIESVKAAGKREERELAHYPEREQAR